MAKKYSNSLTRFRNLVKKDNKRIKLSKRREEKRDLLEWFVDCCPAQDGPEKSEKFDDYNIKFGADYKKLKTRIINRIGLKNTESYVYCQSGNEMEKLISIIEKTYSARHKPIIFFTKGKNGEMDSLYIRIRNSFAHGNYFKINQYYCLWNETGSDSLKLGSFMMLKYEDLKTIYESLKK